MLFFLNNSFLCIVRYFSTFRELIIKYNTFAINLVESIFSYHSNQSFLYTLQFQQLVILLKLFLPKIINGLVSFIEVKFLCNFHTKSLCNFYNYITQIQFLGTEIKFK